MLKFAEGEVNKKRYSYKGDSRLFKMGFESGQGSQARLRGRAAHFCPTLASISLILPKAAPSAQIFRHLVKRHKNGQSEKRTQTS
jgi:hypothetical protein